MGIFYAVLGNRFGQIGLALLAGFFYGFYSVPRVDIAKIEANAIAGRDGYWQAKLRQESEAHEKAIAAALAAAEAEPDTPADMAERLRICASSPTCRNKDGR